MTVAVNLRDGNTFPHSISNIREGRSIRIRVM